MKETLKEVGSLIGKYNDIIIRCDNKQEEVRFLNLMKHHGYKIYKENIIQKIKDKLSSKPRYYEIGLKSVFKTNEPKYQKFMIFKEFEYIYKTWQVINKLDTPLDTIIRCENTFEKNALIELSRKQGCIINFYSNYLNTSDLIVRQIRTTKILDMVKTDSKLRDKYKTVYLKDILK